MTENQNSKIQKFAEIFKALSNQHRLRIFMRLASCCAPGTACSMGPESCVGEIGKDLKIAPSTISHHIKELHRAGLIKMKRCERRIECWVDPKILEDLAAYFTEPNVK